MRKGIYRYNKDLSGSFWIDGDVVGAYSNKWYNFFEEICTISEIEDDKPQFRLPFNFVEGG